MRRCILFWLLTCCPGILLWTAERVARGEDAGNQLQIQVQTIARGEPEWEWRQARTELLPASHHMALTIMSRTKPIGSHGYHDVFYSLTSNAGQTWSSPEVIPSLVRTRLDDEADRVVGDLWPIRHPQSGTLLVTGKIFIFEQGTKENYRREQIAYAVYDPAQNTWGRLQTLQLPPADHEGHPFTAANSGCNQPVCLANGQILLPIRYQKNSKKRIYTSTVVRCSFDGKQLRYLEHGSEHTLDSDRGLYEPSLIKHQERYYLTLRADRGAYVARSRDGLNFNDQHPWRFDDQQLLGSENTQQHWMALGDQLFLVYTRRGAENDRVFRQRAPLFVAQVDPGQLCVIRSSEQIVFPNDGGLYGNFGVCNVSKNEAWITCADDGGKRTRNPQHLNEVLLARMTRSR